MHLSGGHGVDGGASFVDVEVAGESAGNIACPCVVGGYGAVETAPVVLDAFEIALAEQVQVDDPGLDVVLW